MVKTDSVLISFDKFSGGFSSNVNPTYVHVEFYEFRISFFSQEIYSFYTIYRFELKCMVMVAECNTCFFAFPPSIVEYRNGFLITFNTFSPSNAAAYQKTCSCANGVINYLISFIGIPPLGWAAEIKTALFTLIIVDTWQWTPFMTIILYAGLQMLPIDVFEAGKIDGVSKFQEILYITIPLLKPLFIIALIFRFMDAFKSFDIIYAITKGGPGYATETLVIRAFFETFKYHKHEVGAVIGVFLLIVTFAMTKFALKALEAKEA